MSPQRTWVSALFLTLFAVGQLVIASVVVSTAQDRFGLASGPSLLMTLAATLLVHVPMASLVAGWLLGRGKDLIGRITLHVLALVASATVVFFVTYLA